MGDSKRYVHDIGIDCKKYDEILEDVYLRVLEGAFCKELKGRSPNLIKYIAMTAIRRYAVEVIKREEDWQGDGEDGEDYVS